MSRADYNSLKEGTSLSSSEAFDTAAPLNSGEWSADGTQWRGTVPSEGTLHIHVVAYPSAHYTLIIRRLSAAVKGAEVIASD